MQTYLNQSGVALSVAVYLAHDNYDYVPDAISATALMKPIRQVILASRVPTEMRAIDISSLTKSRMGTSIHDAIERVWNDSEARSAALLALGYPQAIIDRIVVNHPGPLPPNAIPVYMEQRAFKEVLGRRVSGKFDFVAEGVLEDFKSTSTFTWTHGDNEEKYKLQGSIYRWLSPEIITADYMYIRMFFTDWKQGLVKSQAGYPDTPVKDLRIPLLTLEETQHYVESKLRQHDQYQTQHEQDLPECNDKDLWRKAPTFKYYKNPLKRERSTKNFDNASEAHTKLLEDGSVGVVVEVPGEVVACKFCTAFPICTQKDRYIADGTLKLY